MSSPDTSPSHTHPPSRWKLWIAGFVLLGAAGGAYWKWGATGPAPQERQRFFARGQAVPIRVVPATTGTIEVEIKALGTVTPINTVTVRSRLDGELMRVLFSEGKSVGAGQLLAEIDPRPFQSQLNQVLGQQQENQARLKNAEGDLERYQKLVAEGLITKQQVTTQEALVQQYRGALQANDAQVANARLQLSYTKVIAPIGGRLGLRQVDAGNLIRGGDANGLVVITQMRPISVIFTVPEAELPAVLDAYRRGKRPQVEAWDRSEAALLATGTLQTIDNQIDTTTGTVKLKAQFDNEDANLFPNQFVNARMLLDVKHDAILIPSAAILRGTQGTFVYVVKEDKSVSVRAVKVGSTEGETAAIESGIAAGEVVVTDGTDKLREGAKVEVEDRNAAATAPTDGAQQKRGPRQRDGNAPPASSS